MSQITEVLEVKECETAREANRYLENGDWILLKAWMDKRLCFQKVTVGPNGFEKIQPFDKVYKVYVIGRVR